MLSDRHDMLKPELVAPAGDFAALQASLSAGADAVYLGVAAFNMRAGATNFECHDLPAVREICDAAQARLYLTLNTIVYAHEIDCLEIILDHARQYVDAVICWDPAVIQACIARSIPFHISTQASIANSAAALFYHNLGAKRIVLARENTLEDMQRIREDTGVEVEAFAHGAMCVSQSGRCFLSQFSGGRSANRGDCLQNCRREYEVHDIEDPRNSYIIGKNFVLSAQDLCTLPFLDKLINSGVSALKIEGRSKSAHYVKVVVESYRTALDAAWSKKLTAELTAALMERLKGVYNRGFSNGFYMGRPIVDLSTGSGSQSTYVKQFVGRVMHYYGKAEVAEILVQDTSFQSEDKLVIEGPTTGCVEIVAGDLRHHSASSRDAGKESITLLCPCRVRENDRVYRLVERKAT